jgi:MoaA/NifB/PqqE/SkfB family radical SAM enzyme
MAQPLPRRLRAIARRLRMARIVARALQSRWHPVLAQIVPTRRCNLACEYCNEFDSTSAPIPLEVMLARVDRLAALGTAMVDLSGGEPMLHPGLEQIVRRIRSHGMFAGLLTNGYLLTRARIAALNDAGLDRLQMSIDNVLPDGVSHKSLKVLDQKLRWLAEDAAFDVNVNTVLGAGVCHPTDALVIAKRALSLGFGTSVGLIHDRSGQIAPLDPIQRQVYDELQDLERGFYSHAHDRLFQENLIRGTANEWQCGAGARYLYVCEDGLVHWCSQQRGYPGVPLERYGPEDLDREYSSVKSCAPHCTVSCVHRVALVDAIRDRPLATLDALGDAARAAGRQLPRSVSVLTWMFVTGGQRELFRRLAVRALNATRSL